MSSPRHRSHLTLQEMFEIGGGDESYVEYDFAIIHSSLYEQFFHTLPTLLYKRVHSVAFSTKSIYSNSVEVKGSIARMKPSFINYLVKIITKILSKSKTLESIIFRNMHLSSRICQLLSTAFSQDSSLRKIRFEYVKLQTDDFLGFLNVSTLITHLSFDFCSITSEVVSKLIVFLSKIERTQSKLMVLSLSGNKLTKSDIHLINRHAPLFIYVNFDDFSVYQDVKRTEISQFDTNLIGSLNYLDSEAIRISSSCSSGSGSFRATVGYHSRKSSRNKSLKTSGIRQSKSHQITVLLDSSSDEKQDPQDAASNESKEVRSMKSTDRRSRVKSSNASHRKKEQIIAKNAVFAVKVKPPPSVKSFKMKARIGRKVNGRIPEEGNKPLRVHQRLRHHIKKSLSVPLDSDQKVQTNSRIKRHSSVGEEKEEKSEKYNTCQSVKRLADESDLDVLSFPKSKQYYSLRRHRRTNQKQDSSEKVSIQPSSSYLKVGKTKRNVMIVGTPDEEDFRGKKSRKRDQSPIIQEHLNEEEEVEEKSNDAEETPSTQVDYLSDSGAKDDTSSLVQSLTSLQGRVSEQDFVQNPLPPSPEQSELENQPVEKEKSSSSPLDLDESSD